VSLRQITIITTGGTIEKTYDEQTGRLENRRSILPRMLRRLRLNTTKVNVFELMSKDSLEMTDADRDRIVEVVRATGAADASANAAPNDDAAQTSGVVVLHGTDTLGKTGDALAASIPTPRFPIVLTGAMRPYEMVRSDALQNLTEAIFATGVLDPGVWCVAHGSALRFPGVRKDADLGGFVRDASTD